MRGLSVSANPRCRPTNTILLGGAANLRGYRAGYQANDNLAAASVELRIPITSPLSIGRFGVKAFVDWGAAYAYGEKMADQVFERGIGGGAYLHMTLSAYRSTSLDREPATPASISGMGVTFE